MTAVPHRQPTPATARRRSCAVRVQRGFTLIELLVVVSIIALLIGILIPVLGIARDRARDTICQANQRNIMPAWHSYIAEKRYFPNHQTERLPHRDPPFAGRWAGHDLRTHNHFGQQTNIRTHPLNPYLGVDEKSRSRLDVLICPRDNGAVNAGNGMTLRQQEGSNGVYINDNGSDSMGLIYGNSYYANDWIWANVGAIDGVGRPTKRWNHWNIPDQVLIYPSDTFALVDGGASYPLSMTQAQLSGMSANVGWWHGEGVANIAMWDGSARVVESQLGGAGPQFNRWLIPERHDPTGTPVAAIPYIRNPELAHTDTSD